MKIQEEDGGMISLLALKTGQSRMVYGQSLYEILVLPESEKLKALLLDQSLKKMWGLDWSLSPEGRLIVNGTLNRLYDWIQLSKIAKQQHIIYEFRALPGEGLKPGIQSYFETVFEGLSPPEIAWGRVPPMAYIPKGSYLGEYESILQPFGLSPKEDPLWLSPSPFLEIEMALVESLSSEGFSYGGSTIPELEGFSSLLGFLNAMKSRGLGRTLHHSSALTQSGKALEIHSGGQIPFSLHNFKTETESLKWKSHGLRLELVPQLDRKDQIELKIKASISEPLPTSSSKGLSPLKTQSLKSRVLLKDGEILKIFQLEKKSSGEQSHGGLSFLLSLPSSLMGGSGKSQISQMVFVQAKIARRLRGSKSLKSR